MWPLLAALLPAAAALTFKSESVEVNFDDRTSTPAAFTLNHVGTYGRLHWDGFAIDEPHAPHGADSYTGVEVKSAPNFAGALVDARTQGSLPAISTDYEGSQVAFFDLEKFWWGCSTTEEQTNRQVPGWCTLEVYGYTHDSPAPVAKAISFFFPAADVTSMAMVEAHLPSSFKGVTRVEFNVLAARPILYLDNVRYKIYNVTDLGRGLSEVINDRATSQSELQVQLNGQMRMGP